MSAIVAAAPLAQNPQIQSHDFLMRRQVGSATIGALAALRHRDRTGEGQLIDVCLKENDRRLGIYDARLKRPRFVPFMARLARRMSSAGVSPLPPMAVT